jgi:hypothetical protein
MTAVPAPTTTLRPGMEIKCPHCHRWHVAERQNAQGHNTHYAANMLYVVCGGSLFYVGNVGTLSRHPMRPRLASSCGCHRYPSVRQKFVLPQMFILSLLRILL